MDSFERAKKININLIIHLHSGIAIYKSGIFDRHISAGAGKVIQYVFWVSFPEPDSLDVHRAEYSLWHK